jgi:hypothetical protein
MRMVRVLALGCALAALVPATASAQAGRHFKDAWFWGAKAGAMSFSTMTTKNAVAPVFGGEMLITRHRGALYVAADQSFFEENAGVFDSRGEGFEITMRDMRRVTLAAMAFPKSYGPFRPYAGLGVAMNFIQKVGFAMDPTFESAAQGREVTRRIADTRDRAAFIAIGGVQMQFMRFSVFGQGSIMPAQTNFFFSDRSTLFIEYGIRYNIGPSIDRPQ